MALTKTRTWQGRRNPRRDRCPSCNRKGLGPQKMVSGIVAQNCRYCGKLHHIIGEPTVSDANPRLWATTSKAL